MKTKQRKSILNFSVVAVFIAAITPALHAGDHTEMQKEVAVYKDAETNVALNGIDPISYHTADKALAGNPEISTEWGGAIWYFSNEKNRETFLKEPKKYVPEFGGHCSYSVMEGQLHVANPECFTVEAGKLYLHVNNAVKKKFEKNLKESIKLATVQWGALQSAKDS
jgi:YHS domain-containing protein